MPAVEIQKAGKVFQKDTSEVVALDNVTLDIDAGAFLSLKGPSGSAKSTLLNLIVGIDRLSSGRVVVLGDDIAQMSESRLAVWRNNHIGFVFQTFNLIPVLTAQENVANTSTRH